MEEMMINKKLCFLGQNYLVIAQVPSDGTFCSDWYCVPDDLQGRTVQFLHFRLLDILQTCCRLESKILRFKEGEILPKNSLSYWIGRTIVYIDTFCLRISDDFIYRS